MDWIRPGIRLTLLALGCGLLVSITNALTRDTVLSNRAQHAARQLVEVAGNTSYDIVAIGPGRFALMQDGSVAGFIIESTTNAGYNGRISLWLALDLNGQVLGVRVKEHEETPGLGDKIELAVSNWILSFNGAGAATGWNLKRDGGEFDQFTGATITPRAVVHAVRDGRNRFLTERDELLREAQNGT